MKIKLIKLSEKVSVYQARSKFSLFLIVKNNYNFDLCCDVMLDLS